MLWVYAGTVSAQVIKLLARRHVSIAALPSNNMRQRNATVGAELTVPVLVARAAPDQALVDTLDFGSEALIRVVVADVGAPTCVCAVDNELAPADAPRQPALRAAILDYDAIAASSAEHVFQIWTCHALLFQSATRRQPSGVCSRCRRTSQHLSSLASSRMVPCVSNDRR